MSFNHIPVMLNEVIENLKILPSGKYVDCTIGGAGHSSEIVKRLNKFGLLLGFDKDIDAICASKEKLKNLAEVKTILTEEDFASFNIENFKNRILPLVIIVKDDFKNFKSVVEKLNLNNFNGALIDLGVSSHQIDTGSRGFSFRLDAPLDMRMDQSSSLTAKEIVNNYSEKELADIFYKFGEEEFSFSIAKNIVKFRQQRPLETTLQLNEIVENSMPKKIVFSRGGAAKKVFQALRIVVNNELVNLDKVVEDITSKLEINGRLAIISFHSLEDRIIKNAFKELSKTCVCPPNFPKCVCNHKPDLKIVSKKPITASKEELELNSRSSCAKLRIAEKV